MIHRRGDSRIARLNLQIFVNFRTAEDVGPYRKNENFVGTGVLDGPHYVKITLAPTVYLQTNKSIFVIFVQEFLKGVRGKLLARSFPRENRLYKFNSSQRLLRSSFEDERRWGILREPRYQQRGDRSYGIPKP